MVKFTLLMFNNIKLNDLKLVIMINVICFVHIKKWVNMKNVKCWGLNLCIVTVTLNMWSVCPIHLLTSFAMFLPWKHVCIKWSVQLDIQIIVSVSHLFCQFLHDSLLQTNRGQYNWTCWTNRSNAIKQCALSTTYFKARTKDRGDQRGSPWNQNCWRTS